MRQGATYAVAGVLVGIPAAFALARLMQSVVFGITPYDPLTFAAIPATIVGATLLACALPAHRAARVDPTKSMRAD